MAKSRASIFEEPAALDLGGFAPKHAIDGNAPPPEQVKAVSQAAHFPSREAKILKHEPETLSKHTGRRYRTGRNVQLNVKVLQETFNDFYAVTEQQGWVLGYTLQRAVEALQRELANKV
jgi:hypothetical protein